MNKPTKIIIVLFIIFFVSQNLFATTNYVSKTGGHVSPFTSWANAATNIQAAVDVAFDGDIVLVNDGTYYLSRRITVTKNITVKSVHGADKTIVNGSNTKRCFYLYSYTVIDGFTITNGYFRGHGGGVYCYRGGTIENCTISGNSAVLNSRGGGVYCDESGTVQNCTVTGNEAFNGGGVYCNEGGTVQNCTVTGNKASYGVGVYCYGGGTIENCTITGNSTYSQSGHGVGVYCYRGGTIKNCTISGNSAVLNSSGGGVYCDEGGTIQNCTITGNEAYNDGGVYCNKGSTIENCIIWDNLNGNSLFDSINRYNCIEGWTHLTDGIITNNPQFVSASDFHLQATSPCRDVGTNAFAPMPWDLDGNPRIIDGIVDMGAYEFVPEPGLIILYQLIILSFITSRRKIILR